jgi:hypothetical protein
MIKSLWGDEKRTPKQRAQEQIYDSLNILSEGYWVEGLDRGGFDPDPMTDREINQVTDQIAKISNRIAKMLGFDPNF